MDVFRVFGLFLHMEWMKTALNCFAISIGSYFVGSNGGLLDALHVG